MPRDAQGNFTLDPSNPVAPETVISTLWANPTMADIGSEITNSLDRAGRGGMNAPLRLEDGEIFAPSITFQLQPTLGFYRPEDGVLAFVSNSSELMRLSENEIVINTDLTVGDGTGTGAVTIDVAGVSTEMLIMRANTGGNHRFLSFLAPEVDSTISPYRISCNNAVSIEIRGINELEVSTGSVIVASLAGTGSRQVFAAPDGTLSAPP